MSKEKDEKLKNELNDLLQNAESLMNSNNTSENQAIEDLNVKESIEKLKANQPVHKPLDVDLFDGKFKLQAKGVIESMYDFYLDFGVIDRPEYLEKKKRIDGLNISNMFLQLKMTKVVLSKLTADITGGNMNPRTIENFATINSQLSGLIRDQANYMLFLEESYKKAKIETADYYATQQQKVIASDSGADVKVDRGAEGVDVKDTHVHIEAESDFYITSDPTKLLEEINEKSPMSYEEVKKQRSEYILERGDISRFVDPNNKNDLLEHYDVDPSTIESDDDDEDHQDIMEMI